MARRKKGQEDQVALFQDALFDTPAAPDTAVDQPPGDDQPEPAEGLHQDPSDHDGGTEDEGLADADQAAPAAPVPDPPGRPDGDPDDAERVVAVTETVVSRTCGWCGKEIDLRGRRGRPPKYCGKKHRNKAYEVRSAEARLGRELAAGTLAADPVREVVDREIRIEVPVIRTVEVAARHPMPSARPADPMSSTGTPATARGWQDHLAALEEQIRSGGIRHYDHRRVYAALGRVASAIDAAHPGGLTALLRGR